MIPGSAHRQQSEEIFIETEPLQTAPELPLRSYRKKTRPVSLVKLMYDGLSLLFVILAWLACVYFLKPVRRPFVCSDLSLYHMTPATPTFPTGLLIICSILIPLIIILLTEAIRGFYLGRQRTLSIVYELRIHFNIHRIPEWIGRLYITLGAFVFAVCVNQLLTTIGKKTVGRLRPHFIPSCFQKYSYKDFCQDPNQWIVNYTCIGESASMLNENYGVYDIRESFPSGHTSTAFCGLMFLILYIYKAWRYRNFGFFPYLIQILCFALAAYVGISRITDYRHHPSDVITGAIVGSGVALLAFQYMVKTIERSTVFEFGP